MRGVSSRRIHFDEFVLDPTTSELSKGDIRIRLQVQSVKILQALLERPGELVTRDELRGRLWPARTFGDFEHGLNVAVKRLRDALADAAEQPRLIDTLPRRGYRYIGPLPHMSSSDRIEAKRSRFLAAAAVGVLVLAVASGFLFHSILSRPTSHDDDLPLTRTSIEFPLETQWTTVDVGQARTQIALTEDGRRLAYVGLSNGASTIFVRDLADQQVRPINGTVGAIHPFFSPDGTWLGFLTRDQVKKVSLSGEGLITLGNVRAPVLARWLDDGRVYVVDDEGRRLWSISAAGGEPIVLADTREQGRVWFSDVLPGGRAALATRWKGLAADDADIVLVDISTNRVAAVIGTGYGARYVRSGHIVFARSGNLFASSFDLGRRRASGRPILLVSSVSVQSAFGHVQAAVAPGVLAYVPGSDGAVGTLTWVQRDGSTEPVDAARRLYGGLDLSRDGRRLAAVVGDVVDYIWVFDIARGQGRRLPAAASAAYPVWNPDGSRIAAMLRDPAQPRQRRFRIQPADDGAPGEPVNSPDMIDDWSPDGRVIAFRGLYFLSIDTGRTWRLAPSAAFRWGTQFSPDGRWIAYTSNETGRFEIWIRSFPNGEVARQISSDGGMEPVWCPNGELFFSLGNRWMSTQVTTTAELRWNLPQLVFQVEHIDTAGRSYDISPDGKHLLVVRSVDAPPTHLDIVFNWRKVVVGADGQ